MASESSEASLDAIMSLLGKPTNEEKLAGLLLLAKHPQGDSCGAAHFAVRPFLLTLLRRGNDAYKRLAVSVLAASLPQVPLEAEFGKQLLEPLVAMLNGGEGAGDALSVIPHILNLPSVSLEPLVAQQLAVRAANVFCDATDGSKFDALALLALVLEQYGDVTTEGGLEKTVAKGMESALRTPNPPPHVRWAMMRVCSHFLQSAGLLWAAPFLQLLFGLAAVEICMAFGEEDSPLLIVSATIVEAYVHDLDTAIENASSETIFAYQKKLREIERLCLEYLVDDNPRDTRFQVALKLTGIFGIFDDEAYSSGEKVALLKIALSDPEATLAFLPTLAEWVDGDLLEEFNAMGGKEVLQKLGQQQQLDPEAAAIVAETLEKLKL